MKIDFYKFHGTGNDFVILDNRDKVYSVLNEKDIALICNRRFGVGADGLIMLEKLDTDVFFMRFYNCDGRETSMCGNGGRCIAAFADFLKLTRNNSFNFSAVDGPHLTEVNVVSENLWLVKLKMQDVSSIEKMDEGVFLNTGSPHLVRFTDDVERLDIFQQGAFYRHHAAFAPDGTNVNFVKIIDAETIRLRTYERGVEAETLSCGTGSVAAAIAAFASQSIAITNVNVITSGGSLKVRFNMAADDQYNEIWLIGPAQMVFKGEFFCN